MSLIEERMQQAQELSLGKVIKNYLDKREPGTTFTVASVTEALNLQRKETNRVYGLLMNAAKTGYIKRLELDDASAPVTFRLDKDNEWSPRNSSTPVLFDEAKWEDDEPTQFQKEIGTALHDALRPQPIETVPEVIERRTLDFVSVMQPGSKFGAHHIAERLAYHTTSAHDTIMAVLLRLRKEGHLKSMPGAGKPVFEMVKALRQGVMPADEPHGQPAEPVRAEVVLQAPEMAAALPVPVPAPPQGLAELQEQLLNVASALEQYRSPLSAYSIAELADEIARRSRGEG